MPPVPPDFAENILLLAGLVAGVKLAAFKLAQSSWLDLDAPADLKFAERAWRIAFTVVSVRLTINALEDLDLLQTFDLGTNAAAQQQCTTNAASASPLPASAVTVYLVQLALYLPLLLFHHWISEPEDYLVMGVHHLVSLLLCAGALLARWPPVWGLVTLLTHDVADLALDSLRLIKELNWPTLTALLYIVALVTWASARCFYYPLYVLSSVVRASFAGDDAGCRAACAGLLVILAADVFWCAALVMVGAPQVLALLRGEGRTDDGPRKVADKKDEDAAAKKRKKEPPKSKGKDWQTEFLRVLPFATLIFACIGSLTALGVAIVRMAPPGTINK